MKEYKIKIELYNKSCFELLKNQPSNSIDLILIDPPYEISKDTGFSNGGGIERFAVSMDFGKWDKNFCGLEEVVKESYRILKKGGTFICFYDLWKISILKEYMDNANFKQIRFIEWLKTNPVPLNSKINYLTNAREIALLGVKNSKPTFNSEYDNGVYSFPICHEKGRFHPTQKNLSLIQSIIIKHSNEGDLIMDCFSGSGTTAIASLLSNRNFIGCEIDSNFHKQSIERILKYNINADIEY